jgi:hypothetical protein
VIHRPDHDESRKNGPNYEALAGECDAVSQRGHASFERTNAIANPPEFTLDLSNIGFDVLNVVPQSGASSTSSSLRCRCSRCPQSRSRFRKVGTLLARTDVRTGYRSGHMSQTRHRKQK